MGLDQEGRGLFQYVIEDEDSGASKAKTGRRVIQLDDAPQETRRKYTPPQKIAIYLSKIELPELQPKATTSKSLSGNGSLGSQRQNGQPVAAPTPRRESKPQGTFLSSPAPPIPEKKKTSADSVPRPESAQTDDKPSRISRLFRSKS